jgi:Uri superfamily endonuclease
MVCKLKFPRRATVYGMSLKKEQGPGSVRYVGSTVQTLGQRLSEHFRAAREGYMNTVNCMLRKHKFAVRLTVLEVVTVHSFVELRKLETMYMDIYNTREPGGWNIRRAFSSAAQKKEWHRGYCLLHKVARSARAIAWSANNRARVNEMQRARYAAKKLERDTMCSLYKPCMFYPGFVME